MSCSLYPHLAGRIRVFPAKVTGDVAILLCCLSDLFKCPMARDLGFPGVSPTGQSHGIDMAYRQSRLRICR